MNVNDLLAKLTKLNQVMDEQRERNKEAEEDIKKLGVKELEERGKELELLYPGQAMAIGRILVKETEPLMDIIQNTNNLACAVPHSLADWAWDMLSFYMQAAVLQCDANKRAEVIRRMKLNEKGE